MAKHAYRYLVGYKPRHKAHFIMYDLKAKLLYGIDYGRISIIVVYTLQITVLNCSTNSVQTSDSAV